jgi:ribonuclease E
MKKEMLINVSQPEECRIAIVEDGVLEEFYLERTSQDNYVGNIYKGVVVNLEPSIQAAFVDFGVGKNGFLHISDVEPQYFRQGGYDPNAPLEDKNDLANSRYASDFGDDDSDDDDDDVPDESGSSRGGRKQQRGGRHARVGARPRVKPPIQEILKRGDEVLVQVIKEGSATKGRPSRPTSASPVGILVLMPALGRVGVSRKIDDDQVRRRLRTTLLELEPPKGWGSSFAPPGRTGPKKSFPATWPTCCGSGS